MYRNAHGSDMLSMDVFQLIFTLFLLGVPAAGIYYIIKQLIHLISYLFPAEIQKQERGLRTPTRHSGKEMHQLTPTLANDLKSLYSNGILCDIKLRTPTQTFSVHKAILGARSAVFRKMFCSDMQEKNTGLVNITDLEDETVDRMLTYMYTDSLGDLQMESASKLLTVADKYDIPSLNRMVSSFLKNNLSPTEACDVLVLADMHQDDDLKKFVQDYISKHDKEIFNTQEWKHFMTTHLQLAAEVMYQKLHQAKT